ncbi:EamA-like transporter family protein [Pelosinus propionicus DSM 13327]|uniref:EamA-like transporter family protein n=1 Tax=Pelosinus propionicus DSM 13327 TaxID=1123291 RepID=A0A1I4NTU6_9FIRM|nr:EamA family transporter [Pelosinus propionicus]SFM18931.1 EamA-like transporter family protein [Pelosinus propionicus DSM 13327]
MKSLFSNIHLLLLTVPVFWGTSYVAAKIGMQDLLPLNLVIVRFIIASLLFSLILLLKKKEVILIRKMFLSFSYLV